MSWPHEHARIRSIDVVVPSKFQTSQLRAPPKLITHTPGVDGLVHVSKIQDRAKTSPEEMREKFSPGQEVQVYILAVSEEEGKLSLTMVPPKSKADLSQFQDLPAGTLLDGTVVSTTTYGAFVRLPGGIDGMVHISEICDERIENVTDKLNVGDEVSFDRFVSVYEKSGILCMH